MEPTTLIAPLLTDDDLQTINAARDLLDRIQSDARARSNAAPVFNGLEANCGDYARVSERAGIAADSLFDLLNLTNATRIQPITHSVMHRTDDAA